MTESDDYLSQILERYKILVDFTRDVAFDKPLQLCCRACEAKKILKEVGDI